MELNSLKVLQNPNRNSCVDLFRGIAILAVVLFHFNNLLPYGFLGVDLFFVISGLLVGGILIAKFENGDQINFKKFFIQRSFKIMPSYFVFLILGSVLAIFFYSTTNPDEIISIREIPKYLFFYKNFSFEPVHSSFDQVWSLCVEEHFYLILPLAFIVLQKKNITSNQLILLLLCTIALGISLKIASLYLTRSGDTSFKTHTRIDALTWGVLLSLLLRKSEYINLKNSIKLLFATLGLILIISTLLIDIYFPTVFFHKIMLNSIIPFSFALMIFGLYNYNFKKLFILRIIAYYSYNWYLWHALFIKIIINKMGVNLGSFSLYLLATFSVAVFFTITIEETFLRIRKKLVVL